MSGRSSKREAARRTKMSWPGSSTSPTLPVSLSVVVLSAVIEKLASWKISVSIIGLSNEEPGLAFSVDPSDVSLP